MRSENPQLASHPVAQLPGISAAFAVALNRVGIISIADLLAADFDRIAYIVDSYDHAETLVREAMAFAKKHAPPLPRASGSEAYGVAGSGALPAAGPVGRGASVAEAIAEACRVEEVGEAPGAGLSRLARRLDLAARMGEATPSVLAAAILHDVAERPDWPARRGEYGARFGVDFVQAVEQCASLRIVPLSPAGGPGRSYMGLMESCTRSARLICAGVTLAAIGEALEGVLRRGEEHWKSHPGGPECALWYFRLVASALRATESGHPLVDALTARLGELERASGRAAA